MKRNHRGYRVGQCHHRSRHSDDLVRRARELRGSGYTYTAIAAALGVHWRTVADWVNYATRYA